MSIIKQIAYGSPGLILVDGFSNSLLLDLLKETPAVAYSVRKLRTDYKGACLRLRRDSDNVERNIGFLNNYLNISDAKGFLGNNRGWVSCWYDQSGNNNNAVLATAVNQPELILRKNRALLLYHDSGNTNLDFQTRVENTRTLFFAARYSRTANYGIDDRALLIGDTANSHFLSGRYSYIQQDEFDSPFSNGVIKINNKVVDGKTTFYPKDNVIYTAELNGSAPASTLSNHIFGGRSWKGERSEVVVFREKLDPETINTINKNMYEGLCQRPFFDSYSDRILGAYSFRRLKTDYTGNCVRVRRVSDNVELAIGFEYNYLDTKKLRDFLGSGEGRIISWFDQSGNELHARQLNPVLQPRIHISGTISVLSSDNGNEYLDLDRPAFPKTMFLTVKHSNSAAPGGVSALLGDSTVDVFKPGANYMIGSPDSNKILESAINVDNIKVSDPTKTPLPTSISNISIDSDQTFKVSNISRRLNQSGSSWKGNIYEVILIKDKLDIQDVSNINKNMMDTVK